MKKLTPPAWQKDARIDPLGWRHPKTGELLLCRRFSPEQIEAYNGNVMEQDNGGNIPGLKEQAGSEGPEETGTENQAGLETVLQSDVVDGDEDADSVDTADDIVAVPETETPEVVETPYSDMLKSELYALAVSKGLKVSTRTVKEDLIKALEAAE
jgi:hypothetical protein